MRFLQRNRFGLGVCCILFCLPLLVWGQEIPKNLPNPEGYVPTPEESYKLKKAFDDPTDLKATFPPKKYLPPEVIKLITFDMTKAGKDTEEILGFKAPDVVGKIAPAIKPGKYTYKDLQSNPGFKELFPPALYNRIKQGEPPLAGNIMDFEIEPTIQMPWSPGKIAQTRKNMETAKLDKEGFLVEGTWHGGIPFPRPSGPQMARQVLYNMDRRSAGWDYNERIPLKNYGIDKNLKIDSEMTGYADYIKLGGRVLFPPFGWLDERSKKNGEIKASLFVALSPRNLKGTNQLTVVYDSPDKLDQVVVYVPSLRRVRKLSASDTQDQGPSGGDMAIDDSDFWGQKLKPGLYPYEVKVEEREYLMPYALKATNYVDSKQGYAVKNFIVQRRPVYRIEMKQLDPSYIYSKRVYYFERETNTITNHEVYDQKGRLYRTGWESFNYFPEYGECATYGVPAIFLDHIDLHSTILVAFNLPCVWSRDHFTLETMIRYAK